MGFTPAAVGAMSVWEFSAVVTGYLRAHAPAEGAGMSATEEDAVWSTMQRMGHVH